MDAAEPQPAAKDGGPAPPETVPIAIFDLKGRVRWDQAPAEHLPTEKEEDAARDVSTAVPGPAKSAPVDASRSPSSTSEVTGEGERKMSAHGVAALSIALQLGAAAPPPAAKRHPCSIGGCPNHATDDGYFGAPLCQQHGGKHMGQGRWTPAEHEAFLAGLRVHGKNWKRVAARVRTRTVVQTRTHAQKYFERLQKEPGVGSGDVSIISVGRAKAGGNEEKRTTAVPASNVYDSHTSFQPNRYFQKLQKDSGVSSSILSSEGRANAGGNEEKQTTAVPASNGHNSGTGFQHNRAIQPTTWNGPPLPQTTKLDLLVAAIENGGERSEQQQTNQRPVHESQKPAGKPKQAQKRGGGQLQNNTFRDRVAQLTAYKKQHGHLNVREKDEASLYHFCKRARAARRHPEGNKAMKMTEERLASLDALGFDWAPSCKTPKGVGQRPGGGGSPEKDDAHDASTAVDVGANPGPEDGEPQPSGQGAVSQCGEDGLQTKTNNLAHLVAALEDGAKTKSTDSSGLDLNERKPAAEGTTRSGRVTKKRKLFADEQPGEDIGANAAKTPVQEHKKKKASLGDGDSEKKKRGPGRPPGSKNKKNPSVAKAKPKGPSVAKPKAGAGAVPRHRICSVPRCPKQVQQGGFCYRHGGKNTRGACSHAGCTNPSKRGGLCRRHGAFKLKTCARKGCKRVAKKGDFCDSHSSATCVKAGCRGDATHGEYCKAHHVKLVFDRAKKSKRAAPNPGPSAEHLRGVTMRPSGKWQAQLYYAGKSLYIGVYDSKEEASVAYENAREALKGEKVEGPAKQKTSAKEESQEVQAMYFGGRRKKVKREEGPANAEEPDQITI